MASGQAPGPAQQGPYPPYQPMYQPPRKAAVEYMKPLVSDMMLTLLVVLGLFLVWLGSLLWGTIDDADGDKWGLGIKSFGMLIVTVALFAGGILRADLDRWVRVALIAAAVTLICIVGYWGHAGLLGSVDIRLPSWY